MVAIKFKAKKYDSSEWVFGDLIINSTEDVYIQTSYNHRVKVIPETVCQYIWVCDENGNDIYTNDIIEKTFIHKNHTQVKQKTRKKKIVVKLKGIRTREQTENMLKLNPHNNVSSSQQSPFISYEYLDESDKDNFTHVDLSVFSNCKLVGNIYDS